jgi:hypothetical protein
MTDAECQALWQQIDDGVNKYRPPGAGGTKGLKWRWDENIDNALHPELPDKGKKKWKGHQEAYNNQRRGLRSDKKKWDDHCKNNHPPTSGEALAQQNNNIESWLAEPMPEWDRVWLIANEMYNSYSGPLDEHKTWDAIRHAIGVTVQTVIWTILVVLTIAIVFVADHFNPFAQG